MTTSAMRPLRARLRITTSAAVVFLCALASIAHGAQPPAGAITFVGTDANIYYCDAKCSQPKCITCKAAAIHVRRDDALMPVADTVPDAGPPAGGTEYGWPTFSPDGKRIAYSSETHKQGEDSFAVWVYDLARSQAMLIFESRSERIVYMVWTPDAEHLSFLLGEPRGLSLVLAEVKESTPVRIVTTGMPLYFDWGAPGEVALHTLALDSDRTEQVSLMSLTPTSQNVVKVLSSGRTPFKTPAWSRDGKHLAYIANYHAESNIVVADADGSHPRSVVSLPVGENSFVWAPDSAHLAYSTAITPQDPTYHGIKLVDIVTANSKWLTKDEVIAFFFAPDSRHVAFIGVPEDKPYYTWSVVGVKTGAEKLLCNFLATPDESTAYRYFDQLAVSHTIWSPDSSSFIYAGVRLTGSPEHALGIAPAPSAWIVPIDGSDPHAVANAVLAFFSPK